MRRSYSASGGAGRVLLCAAEGVEVRRAAETRQVMMIMALKGFKRACMGEFSREVAETAGAIIISA